MRPVNILLVSALALCASSCASPPALHTGGAARAASCDAADVARRYSYWLITTGLVGAISVQQSPSKEVLVLQVSDAYPALRRAADKRRLDLDRSLYFQLARLTCQGGPSRVAIRSPARCDNLNIYEAADGAVTLDGEICRGGGEVTLSPQAIKALGFAPATGKVLSDAGWVALPLLAQRLRGAFAGKGSFDLIKLDDRQVKFTVKGMRNEILAGEKWWEWLDVSIWIDAQQPLDTDSTPQPTVLLHWQASARYGAGLSRPPASRAGYTNDIEPEHQQDLVDYVDKVLLRVRNSLAAAG
jgi:hypothetical protein